MENYKKIIDIPLFGGVDYMDIGKLLTCLEARTQYYAKEAFVVLAGDPVPAVGIIIEGGVRILREDINGQSMLLTELSAKELFGEAFACAQIHHSPVTVQASEKSEIMFINYRRIITSCSSACGFHTTLIGNMLRLMAQKNLMLNQKIEILAQKTTREKLMMFFNSQRKASAQFTVPYNREEMARYLCVDRSAMSHELSKMRQEGLIRFHKNTFEICRAGKN